MPGWSFSNQDCETLSSQLSAFLFCRKAFQRFEARLLLCPIWSRYLDAAFRSPTAAACFQTAAARSTLPACLFDATLELSSNPFDLPLRCSLRFAPERAASTRQTRCPNLFRRSPRLLNLHSPQGIFYAPRGSQRSVQRAAEKLTSWTARFPFAPRRPFTFGDRPADHRSGFATFHSARLFREPLGTKAIMPRIAFPVKQKIGVINHFPQQFSRAISCA
jgi:hypothetical protein